MDHVDIHQATKAFSESGQLVLSSLHENDVHLRRGTVLPKSCALFQT